MGDVDYTFPPSKKEILQKLEEKAAKAQEAFEREEKAKKELEGLYNKLLSEKTTLLAQLEGEKGSLSETQERANKLQAQKSDLESQLQVSSHLIWSLRNSESYFFKTNLLNLWFYFGSRISNIWFIPWQKYTQLF